MKSEEAANLAISALLHIADDENKLNRFCALTGILPDEIRSAAGEPGFLAGVLEFLLGHEPDLLEFAEAQNLDPQSIGRAHLSLGGRIYE